MCVLICAFSSIPPHSMLQDMGIQLEVTVQINPAGQKYFWFSVLTSVKSLRTSRFLPELYLQDI